jgi:hypothetical protein
MLLARIQPAQQPIQVGAGVAPVEGTAVCW